MQAIDAAPYLCGPDETLRAVLAALNEAPGNNKFRIVVDEGGRLLGTITDGDVRRALLAGVGLDDPVRLCMNPHPRFGAPDRQHENWAALSTLASPTPFLPLIKPDGTVQQVLLGDRAPVRTAAALVMAGGLGSRLGDITRSTPKPLLDVGGAPILHHIITRLEQAGIQDVFVSVRYLAEQVEQFVATRANRATVSLVHEDEPLGTAGALSLLPRDLGVPVIVMNGDVLTEVDIPAMMAFHRRNGFDITIAAAQYEITIPYGVIRHGEDGSFTGIDEKPSLRHFVSAGIYVLSPEILALVPPHQRSDMPEVINRARTIGRGVGVFPIHEYWVDVGRPADLAAAREGFARRPVLEVAD